MLFKGQQHQGAHRITLVMRGRLEEVVAWQELQGARWRGAWAVDCQGRGKVVGNCTQGVWDTFSEKFSEERTGNGLAVCKNACGHQGSWW